MSEVVAAIDVAARLLDERIGLKPDPSFRPRLARALRDVCEARGTNAETLVTGMSADSRVLDHVLDRVTVQETAFFRHPEHFDAIVGSILPTISGPVQAWSSACANGQEAYSLAMLIREAGRTGSVLATDISPAALQRTKDAAYLEREVGGLNAERRRMHFAVDNNRWHALPPLRDLVSVRRHNLLDPIPPEVANCQIVMCRNVLIYFTQRHAEVFLGRLADAMHADAVLFIGGAETLWHMSARFEPVQIGQSFVYRPKRGDATTRTPAATIRRAATEPTRRSTEPTPYRAQSSSQSSSQSSGDSSARPVLPQTRSAERVPSAERPRSQPTAQHVPAAVDHQAVGSDLLARGAVADAIVVFRQWAYLAADDPSAHFHLGLALESAAEPRAAGRAFRSALSAFDRGDSASINSHLHGYDPAEFRRMLVDRAERVLMTPTSTSTPRGDATA